MKASDLIRDAACNNWSLILETLGVSAVYLKNKHGACPICKAGKDRFRFDDKGKGLYFCNKCGSGDGFKLLQLYHGWSFPHTLTCVAKVLGQPMSFGVSRQINHCGKALLPLAEDVIHKREKSLTSIWQTARLISPGDPVDAYLHARGITLMGYPSVLRFHPHLPYYNEEKKLVSYFPAMLGRVQNKNGLCVTIHRTYLANGCKADVPKPKKLMVPIHPGASQGAAIQLFEPEDGRLALAEGIETALAFHIATQIPVWATISAGGMEKIKLPPSVKETIIAVDHDESGRGQKPAFLLAQRLLAEGMTVKRVIPPKVGYDFADMLVEG